MTYVYAYLWLSLAVGLIVVGRGLYEDFFNGPDHKFGYNLIKTKKWVNGQNVRTFEPVFSAFFWIIVGVYGIPVLNLFALYCHIRSAISK